MIADIKYISWCIAITPIIIIAFAVLCCFACFEKVTGITIFDDNENYDN